MSVAYWTMLIVEIILVIAGLSSVLFGCCYCFVFRFLPLFVDVLRLMEALPACMHWNITRSRLPTCADCSCSLCDALLIIVCCMDTHIVFLYHRRKYILWERPLKYYRPQIAGLWHIFSALLWHLFYTMWCLCNNHGWSSLRIKLQGILFSLEAAYASCGVKCCDAMPKVCWKYVAHNCHFWKAVNAMYLHFFVCVQVFVLV